MTSLAGRIAVVTGGGQGIGAACAQVLAKAGATVIVAARNRDRIAQVANELTAQGHRATPVFCDVTDEASVQALGREAAKLGPVDVLVNNAGAAGSAAAVKTTLAEWNQLFAVNATGAFLCTRAFLPGMLERKWGRVVNVASTAGLQGARYISAYSASKHALVGFTRSVAAEVASSGVTVNAVCPGYVDTEMTRESMDRIVSRTGRSRAEALSAALAASDQPRLITPEEVAAAVAGLCEEAAARVNGEAIVLDGREGATSRFAIINPESLGAPRGWNNGLLTRPGGRLLFIAGQTARDANGKVSVSGFVEQFDQALGNVLTVVRQAGGTASDIGRFTIYVTDLLRYRASLKPLGEVYRRHMGDHYPAMTLVEVRALVDERAEVEIEATAVVGGS